MSEEPEPLSLEEVETMEECGVLPGEAARLLADWRRYRAALEEICGHQCRDAGLEDHKREQCFICNVSRIARKALGRPDPA